MRIVVTAAVALVLVALAADRQRVLNASPAPAVHVIEMKAMKFDPSRLAVHVGDTIVFRNADMFPHTATAARVFDTGELKQKQVARWVVRKSGKIDYICAYHTTMRGTIEVRK